VTGVRAAWLAVGLAVAAAGVPAAEQQPVFRSAADAVIVNVSVRRSNRPVTDLKARDFVVRDNGVRQTVAALVYEKLPVDLTVLLDASGSVSGLVLDQLRTAVLDLRRNLRPDDRLQVLTFDTFVRRLVSFGDSSAAIDQAFASLTGGGASVVRDALAVALASGNAPDRRQFVALFSDGHDNLSVTSPGQLLELARRTTPTVSMVLATPARRQADRAYADLAAETGGTVVSILPTETPRDLLRRALDQFRSSYVLNYVPTGVTRTGRHTIEVSVNRTGLEIRARKAYEVQ
jgi:VWFA-related protein